MLRVGIALLLAPLLASTVSGQGPDLDERPSGAGEWGFRPAAGGRVTVTPPAFTWRPQKGAVTYTCQVAPSPDFASDVLTVDTQLPVYCPDRVLAAGQWFWRFRFRNAKGTSGWSRARRFLVAKDATEFPLPGRAAIRRALPKSHPRLFLRPADLERVRQLANGRLKGRFVKLLARCEKVLQTPPSTVEPAKYPKHVKRRSEAWRKLWWGNRTKTKNVLMPAADLAFAGAVTGEKRFVELAKRLLLEVAQWNPTGATGFRYNDEAGMPYAYWFARTYTFLHDHLSPAERKRCREVMRIRGREMYRKLVPHHFWRPFDSHNNRAWHFLGEIGIAFHDEIPEAEDWLWFASRVFGACYPVWSDDDGGWHEGLAYWRSYLDRFTWWADIQKAAFGVDAYRKPFFSRVGDLVLYLQPPGTHGGGFGDQTGRLNSGSYTDVMGRFARAAGNPYWQWHADQHPAKSSNDFIGFLRATRAPVEAKKPVDLPSSKLFRGTGLAVLNSDLTSGNRNVQVIFKSSPFGTQSHGYEAQNSFLLYAFGERLLIRSGKRDLYGSAHHSKWMWSTRSTNCITANGKGQFRRSSRAIGRITVFRTGADLDYVAGEAGDAYANLTGFTRSIAFIKPRYVLIRDELRADEPTEFSWWLHTQQPMHIDGTTVRATQGKATCTVRFLLPKRLSLKQTDAFDPPPRKRVKLVQHHLTATTPAPARKAVFLTVIKIERSDSVTPFRADVTERTGGLAISLDDLTVRWHGDEVGISK